ncbi:centrosomal protein of 72 kDa isoform X1 [Astyanax mexicanus]|uniref:centrosomal protein of 72 kDa isoform X1 n=1 Tax=Astyanax mexicanus TaxID=7994 RepID=UPI0020CAF497|nr:centrosomal protein of 72 kDa isoform X1 [Astyanax mexicanus]
MRRARLLRPFETMAADSVSVTEQWIREKLSLQHRCLADVRSLSLPGSGYETGKICHLGISLKNFVRLKSLDLSYNVLDSVQGIVHLKLLEKLNLYYNRISSLEEVLTLCRLQNLQELDLRLNPVVQKHPHYRLYLVHAISKLRKLDDCAVRDRERSAALMHFSVESALEPDHSSQLLTEEKRERSSDPRIASVKKMMMRKLSLREGNEETALNHRFSSSDPLPHTERKTTAESQCTHSSDRENASEIIHLINTYDSDASSAQNQHPKTGLGKSHRKHDTHTQRAVRHRKSTLKTSEAPRVTFVDVNGSPERRCSEPVKNSPIHSRTQAESNFTPHPSNKSKTTVKPGTVSKPGIGDDKRAQVVKNYFESRENPVLHPPRLTYPNTGEDGPQQRPSTKPETAGKPCKGGYKKPMELLLSLVDEYWSGKKKNHNTKHFFMHAVRILCMMEQEVVGGEEEMEALKQKIQTLNSRAELQQKHHQSEIQSLTNQLQRAHASIQQLDEQLRSVLEENVSLQKQLIRLGQKLLSDQLREASSSADAGE